MNKALKLAASVAVLPVLAFTTPVFADSPGQLGGGSDVIKVKNITQNGSYSANANVTCNEEVQYSIRLHNAAYGRLTDVKVSANLANGSFTAVPGEGASAGTNGSVTVNVAKGTLAYENGTTILYDANGKAIKTLPDTITSGGVNVGNINGSTTEFVNFKAKVTCPETPKPPVTPPTTPTTPAAPKELPHTGAGDVVATVAGVSLIAGVFHRYFGRRLAK